MGGSVSGTLVRLQSRCQAALQSSEGSAGAGGSASQAVHSHGWQVGAGCSAASGPLHSAAWVSSQHVCWCTPTASEPKGQGGNISVFYEAGSRSHTLSPPQYLVSPMNQPCSVGEGPHKGWTRGDKDHPSDWLPHYDTPGTEVWEILIQSKGTILQRGQELSVREGRQCKQGQPSIFGKVKVRIKRGWSPAQYNSPILHKQTFPLAFQTLGEIQPSLRTRLLSSLQQEADATANY